MNGFIKGMKKFDLQPAPKRKKRTTVGVARIKMEKVDDPDKIGFDFIQRDPSMQWEDVSKAFYMTGFQMYNALEESFVKVSPVIKKVLIATKDKYIADLFDGASIKIKPNGNTYVVTDDKDKADSLEKVSLKVMQDGKIYAVDEEKS